MEISLFSKGDYTTEKFLRKLQKAQPLNSLDDYGREGVRALSNATPQDTGETSRSWTYEIVKDGSSTSIIWSNTHMADQTPVAILIQMGHGTRNGGYVQGRDFINPAMRPIFDQMADKIWKEMMAQ